MIHAQLLVNIFLALHEFEPHNCLRSMKHKAAWLKWLGKRVNLGGGAGVPTRLFLCGVPSARPPPPKMTAP